MWAYRCLKCNHVLVVAQRIVGPVHETKPTFLRPSQTHRMSEVGEIPNDQNLDEIKAKIRRGEYSTSVREIPSRSTELQRGEVRYEKAKVKRWKTLRRMKTR